MGQGGEFAGGVEKRKFKRLPLKLDLSCHRVDGNCEVLHTGRTIDVGPGGIFFQTPCGRCTPGNLLKINVSVPPAQGLMEFGGKISGFAKVLRTQRINDDSIDADISKGGHAVAIEFCQPPKLSV